MKKLGWIAAAAVGIALAIYFFAKPSSNQQPPAPETSFRPQTVILPLPSVIPSHTSPVVAAPSDYKLSPPTTSKVREEATQNPHVTPPSLIAFAAEMGPKLKAALADPAAAHKFMPELRDCVLGSGPESARSLCLVNARLISKKYGELQAPYKEIEEKADPRIRDIVSRLQ